MSIAEFGTKSDRSRNSKPEKLKTPKVTKWDHLIEVLAGNQGHDDSEFGLDLTDREFAVRGMARETGSAVDCFPTVSLISFEMPRRERRVRIMQSPSQCLYVFAYFAKDEKRELRLHELYMRCLIARHKVKNASDVIIGIAFNEFDPCNRICDRPDLFAS